MKNYLISEELRSIIVQVLSTSKNDKLTFGEMFKLIGNLEKLPDGQELKKLEKPTSKKKVK